ncbi:hypothetical protein ACFYNU_25750, partial [Streptomyces sp. NPDC006643]|uniref:hypothetical protein n=1 Tax=Streptomyces sp. NPDC006643 TaxID=3364756 RepID=UPI0036A7DEA3
MSPAAPRTTPNKKFVTLDDYRGESDGDGKSNSNRQTSSRPDNSGKSQGADPASTSRSEGSQKPVSPAVPRTTRNKKFVTIHDLPAESPNGNGKSNSNRQTSSRPDNSGKSQGADPASTSRSE